MTSCNLNVTCFRQVDSICHSRLTVQGGVAAPGAAGACVCSSLELHAQCSMCLQDSVSMTVMHQSYKSACRLLALLPHLQLVTHQGLDELRTAQPGSSKQRRPAARPDGIGGCTLHRKLVSQIIHSIQGICKLSLQTGLQKVCRRRRQCECTLLEAFGCRRLRAEWTRTRASDKIRCFDSGSVLPRPLDSLLHGGKSGTHIANAHVALLKMHASRWTRQSPHFMLYFEHSKRCLYCAA